jgi:uncharacterized protein (TIGR02246 family)
MSREEPVAVVLAFLNAINSRDVDKISALMTDDHLFVDGTGNQMKGKETMRKGWDGYFKLFPDYRVSHEDILSQGEVVAVFGSAEGTYAPDGKILKQNHWNIPAAWKAVVKEGLVKEWRVYADNQPVRKLMATLNP